MHEVQQQQERVRGDILVATSSDLQAFIILAASVVQINAIKNVVRLFSPGRIYVFKCCCGRLSTGCGISYLIQRLFPKSSENSLAGKGLVI